MDYKKILKRYILKPIVYTGLVASVTLCGCEKKVDSLETVETKNKFETISGKVFKEKFIEGWGKYESRFWSVREIPIKNLNRDEYLMLVQSNDGKKFLYIFHGEEARSMDLAYDVNSEIKDFSTSNAKEIK